MLAFFDETAEEINVIHPIEFFFPSVHVAQEFERKYAHYTQK